MLYSFLKYTNCFWKSVILTYTIIIPLWYRKLLNFSLIPKISTLILPQKTISNISYSYQRFFYTARLSLLTGVIFNLLLTFSVNNFNFYYIIINCVMFFSYNSLYRIISFIVDKLRAKLNVYSNKFFTFFRNYNPKGPIKYLLYWYFTFILLIRSLFEYNIVYLLFVNMTSILTIIHFMFNIISFGQIALIALNSGAYLVMIDIYGDILTNFMSSTNPPPLINSYKTYLITSSLTNSIVKRFIMTKALKLIGIARVGTAGKLGILTGSVSGIGWLGNEHFKRKHESTQNEFDRNHRSSEAVLDRAKDLELARINAQKEIDLARLKASQDHIKNPFKGPWSK